LGIEGEQARSNSGEAKGAVSEEVPAQPLPTAEATLSPLKAIPSIIDSPSSVVPTTCGDLCAFVASDILNRAISNLASSNPGTNTAASQDNQQTKLGRRSGSERDVDLEEPEKKRSKAEQVSFHDLPCSP
jgi:hypothetical protein